MTPAQYLREHFPYEHLELFLTLDRPLDYREIALRGDGWFARHQHADGAMGLRELATRAGVKEIHMGACWPEPMSKRTAARTAPVAKELVFDLDLQDQPCATFFGVAKDDQEGNDVLLDCVLLGARVLEEALRAAYGFEQCATFYSGRRGVHLWVLDARAFALTSEARSAVVASLRAKGGTPLAQSPTFASAVDLLVAEFPKLACFREERYRRAFGDKLNIRLVPNEAWVAAEDPWGALLGLLVKDWMAERVREVVVQEAWPRLDEGACAMEHLTKAPFSVHASTGRVCVPVGPGFDPAACPNLVDRRSLDRLLVGFPLVSREPDPLEW